MGIAEVDRYSYLCNPFSRKQQCLVENNNEKAILRIHNGKFSGGINTIKNGDFGKLYIEDGEFLNSFGEPSKITCP